MGNAAPAPKKQGHWHPVFDGCAHPEDKPHLKECVVFLECGDPECPVPALMQAIKDVDRVVCQLPIAGVINQRNQALRGLRAFNQVARAKAAAAVSRVKFEVVQ